MVEWIDQNSGWLFLCLLCTWPLLTWADRRLSQQRTPPTDGDTKIALKENHGTSVAVSPAYFWEPIETVPLGCKVQLKTIPGGIATYGEVNERNRKYFSAWAPLPTTRKDRK